MPGDKSRLTSEAEPLIRARGTSFGCDTLDDTSVKRYERFVVD